MTILTMTEAAAYCEQNKPPGARWHNAQSMLKYHLDNNNLKPLDVRRQNRPVRLRLADLDELLARQERIVDTAKINAEIDKLLGVVPITEIGKRVHISSKYVVQRRQDTGLPTIYENKRKAAEAALAKLYSKGFIDQKIAAEAGVSREMIQKMRTARGWPPVAENGGNKDD